VFLLQGVELPTEGDNPWIWFTGVAVVVIGYLAKSVRDGYEKRLTRCEGREDKVLEDNKAQAATIKEMSGVLLRVVEVTEGIGEMVKVANIKIESTERTLVDVRRALEEFTQPPPPARRRTNQGG
jgi:hypothetical protein